MLDNTISLPFCGTVHMLPLDAQMSLLRLIMTRIHIDIVVPRICIPNTQHPSFISTENKDTGRIRMNDKRVNPF
jgi:hypothetical protein